ncbi:MAG: ABC transporter permease [Chloroherpetonaceae bacterium]|nr:ABC transporter permease [Chloroherpetonaceae bacterium]
MRVQEIFQMSVSSLKANKLRSGLTMFGITVGVFSVIGVMTVIGALQNSITSGLAFLGTNTFQIAKYPAMSFSNRDDLDNRRNITLEQAERFREMIEEQTAGVCLKSFDGGRVASYGNYKTNANQTIVGTNKHFLFVNQHNVIEGRNLTEEDVQYMRSVAVIGQEVRKKLFPNQSALGERIKLNGKVYTVVGVLAAKGQAFGGSEDDLSLVPITRFFADFGKNNRTVNIAVQASSQETYQKTMDRAQGAMRLVRGLQAHQDNDFELYANESLVKSFNEIADVIRAGAFVISFIALITAGIGIMNIMLVSVTERTKEIGIRKSIGAKRQSILIQFLIESVVISELGGLLGILLGALLGNVIAAQMSATAIFPWDWAFIGLFVCSLIGIGFGSYPAYKAAALDPIEALRFE